MLVAMAWGLGVEVCSCQWGGRVQNDQIRRPPTQLFLKELTVYLACKTTKSGMP